jgi:hypothetical protein
MPGIGLEIDGAMQHAPHASRHACMEFGLWALDIGMKGEKQVSSGIVPPCGCGVFTQERCESVS